MTDRLDQLLTIIWLLQKELDNGGQQLQLHLRRLVIKTVQKRLQQLVGIVNALGILANDPHHGRTCLRLVKRVEILAELGNDGLVLVGIFAEDVFDHDNCLLNNVIHL